MRALALDPETGDLLLTAGALSLVSGVEAVAQRLRCRLRLGRGEWFADTSAGVPWFDAILGQKGGDRAAEAILRQAVATCPGVAAVADFAVAFDAAARALTATFLARTVDGATLSVTAGPDAFRWEQV